MSRCAVNSMPYQLKKDPALRARFIAHPEEVLAAADLTEAQRTAFIRRDMRAINELGGYLHLVVSLLGMAAH